MEKFIENFFRELKIGEPDLLDGFQVFPLFSEKKYEVEYLMMKEALEKGLLKVKEVSESGHVPELSAENLSELPILLLGGEELEGAKQNRILNVSILLPPKKRSVIPVSCVERGRWHYKERNFKESDYVAYSRMRKANYEELYHLENYYLNQSRVWEQVSELEMKMGVRSSTDAMKDVYDSKKRELSDYESSIKFHDGQIGILAVSSGKILGFDIIGRSEKFRLVYKKLLRSYIIEDLNSIKSKGEKVSVEDVKKFISDVISSREKRLESVGLGYDYRYRGKSAVGSVLGYNDEVIHAVFFKSEDSNSQKREAEKNEHFSDFNARRRYLEES